jgi:uncharacterized phiE125 gp8 family phage protein
MPLPTLADVKLHLRVDHDYEDALITTILGGAIDLFEKHTRRVLSEQTLTHRLDSLPDRIDLPRGPVTGVTSVTVRTPNGVVTVSPQSYLVFAGQSETRPQIYFTNAASLPNPDGHPYAVTVTYTAATTTIAPSINQAILLMCGHWYENRSQVGPTGGGEVPFAFEAIANKYIWNAYS